MAANVSVLTNANELVLSGSDNLAAATSKLQYGGNKQIHFLPKINKMAIEIGGQDYPGTSTFDRLGANPHIGYKIYKEVFPEDERKINFRDWLYRYFKMRIDYRGQVGIFEQAAGVSDEAGVDTNISTIRLKLEIENAIDAAADLKAFIFHHVPATLLFYP